MPVSQLRIDYGEINIGFRNLEKAINSQTEDASDNIKIRIEPYYKQIEERKEKLEK